MHIQNPFLASFHFACKCAVGATTPVERPWCRQAALSSPLAAKHIDLPFSSLALTQGIPSIGWTAGARYHTSGRISSTFRPRVALSSLSEARTASTALTTSSNRSGSQFRKCTLTQNLLCSTEAPGMCCVLHHQEPKSQVTGNQKTGRIMLQQQGVSCWQCSMPCLQ